ncbi:MAG: radical SAM family heme chaperone HemW [Candidatus Cryptobacteroides sp.]
MIYVHIPFCKSFCTYCGFYSETSVRYDAFADALLREIDERQEEISGTLEVPTLYIGGGTPTVLPLSVLERIVSRLDPMPLKEFTIEANPEDIVEKGPAYAEALLRLGVNRVSMGVQSFDDRVLKWMNRRHSAATALKAYQILEDAGFDNISIDLIFGFSASDTGGWAESLSRALEISASGMPPRHISAYQLSVEPDSAMERMIWSGKVVMADDETCAREYEMLCSKLRQAGYHHYEISNFAQPGFEAVHNSAYWSHHPYVGLGPGAHSFGISHLGQYRRSWNKADLEAYMAERPCSGEILTEEQIGMEEVMLALRTSTGISSDRLCVLCSETAVRDAMEGGSLEKIASTGNVRIPEDKFFVSDNIIAELCNR